jgi:hypothetical protein
MPAMKNLLRKVFQPLLRPLESGDEPFSYERSHRIILLVVGTLFIGLGGLVLVIMPEGDLGYLLPVVVFGGAGLLALIIGTLGSERAVAKIWGSR